MLSNSVMRGAVVALVLLVLGVWALVVWLQPRMAFLPWPGVQATPASAGLPFIDLKIPTGDGETLHGWWMEHPSPRAQVVYWHGNGGNLSVWLDALVELRRRGFSVMAVDYRGYGASTGSPSEKGLYRDGDAATRYFFAHLRKPGVPVVFWGRSLGCAVASYTATRGTPDALVLESPFPDVKTLFAGNPVMLALSLFSTYRFPTSKHLESYRGPLLVIHGNADSIIPFRSGRAVFDRAPTAKKTFAVLEGADHNDAHGPHPAYFASVDAFIASLER